MDLSRTVSDINGDIGRQTKKMITSFRGCLNTQNAPKYGIADKFMKFISSAEEQIQGACYFLQKFCLHLN